MVTWAQRLGWVFASVLALGVAAESRSLTDGVFSIEQAERGATLYTRYCAECHLEDLSGQEMSPGLKGVAFRFRWADLTLFDLFDRVARTMPTGAPGTLAKTDYAAVVAYLLEANGYPSGPVALPINEAALRAIEVGPFTP